MNKLIARISARFLLVFGLLFGGAFLLNNFTSPASAVDTPSTVVTDDDPVVNRPDEEGTTGSNNPNTSDDSANADSSENPNETENSESPEESDEASTADDSHNACQEQTGSLSWLVCPGSGVIANAIDALYTAIGDMLEISPVSMDDSSPIYIVWQYARNITNIIFVIFLLIVIYSQLTGFGINNYGIKRVLPRLIIAVLLVNLSFIICSLAVDVSNIIGNSLRSFFATIQENVVASGEASEAISNFSMSSFLATVISGGAIAGVVISAVGGGGYLFFMLLIVLVSAVIAVATGLITISARQALVALLIMIAPLAFVAYLLPNTEKWFTRWKDLLFRMLIFYPMFSFLFGASQLVGYTIIISANSGFGIILGIAVQFFPLFFSWSLMKMSGTVLNNLNSGLRRIASPVQKGLAGWSLSKADQQRQHHLANSNMSGARLRRYLDKRRVLREVDTENSANIRKNRATEGAYKIASSSLGRDAEGNLIWEKRANRYTVNAKRAKLSETRATTAQTLYQNTLSGYSDFFTDHTDESHRIATAHGEAFQDAMTQQFLAKNIAQADQEWLLGKFFEAGNELTAGNPYQYNRLVRSANGTMPGTQGETSVLGQVIVENATIEARRRKEAGVILAKFPHSKALLRAMNMDRYGMTDDGFAKNSKGEVIEDKNGHLLPGKEYEEYPHYFAVHNETGKRIEKDAYLKLSPDDREEYHKVRYMYIEDDHGNFRQLVTSDDAAYMKEMLSSNVFIADPINRRFATELGSPRSGSEGILRRYQSTIVGALRDSKYKEHNAAYTEMLLSHLAQGLIHSSGQLHIAELQSLNVAAKNGPILISDAYALDQYRELLETINNDELFAQYISDEDIATYQDVNSVKLKGYLLGTDKNGNTVWQELSADEVDNNLTDAEALTARKNYLKHNILAKTANRLFTAINRDLSPGVLENQKPSTLKALIKLIDTVSAVGHANLDSNLDFTQKLRGDDPNIVFSSPNPKILQDKARAAYEKAQQLQGIATEQPNTKRGQAAAKEAQDVQQLLNYFINAIKQTNTAANQTPDQSAQNAKDRINSILEKQEAQGLTDADFEDTSTDLSTNPTLNNLMNQLKRADVHNNIVDERNDFINIQNTIHGTAEYSASLRDYCSQLTSYFRDVESLSPHLQDLDTIMDEALRDTTAFTTEEAITNIVANPETERPRIEALRDRLLQFINNHI